VLYSEHAVHVTAATAVATAAAWFWDDAWLYSSRKFRAPVTHGHGKSYRAICLPRRDDCASEAGKNRRIAREDTRAWLNRHRSRSHSRSRRRCRHSKAKRRWPMVPVPNVRVPSSENFHRNVDFYPLNFKRQSIHGSASVYRSFIRYSVMLKLDLDCAIASRPFQCLSYRRSRSKNITSTTYPLILIFFFVPFSFKNQIWRSNNLIQAINSYYEKYDAYKVSKIEHLDICVLYSKIIFVNLYYSTRKERFCWEI